MNSVNDFSDLNIFTQILKAQINPFQATQDLKSKQFETVKEFLD